MVITFPPWRLVVATLFHSLVGYSIFFETTVVNPNELFVKQLANKSIIDHYGVQVSIESLEFIWAGVSTSLMVGALIGCVLIKYPAEKFGRRNTVMIMKNLIMIASGLIQFLCQPLNSIELLIIGRILGGIAFTQTFIIPVFLAESSPTQFRGLVSSMPSAIGSRLWSLAGALLPLLVKFTSINWNYLLLCSAVPALVHLIGTPFFPKSVKHLYITKENRKLSRQATAFYHGASVNTAQYFRDMDKEAEISPTVKIATLKILLAAEQFRTPSIICIVAAIMVPIGGNSIVSYYSAGILRSVGISDADTPLYNVLFIQLPMLPVQTLSVLLLEKIGRRSFMLTGVALCSLGMSILGLASLSAEIHTNLPSILSVVGLILVVVGLSVGPYLVPPVLPGELVPQASRSLTLSISRFFSTLLEVLIGLSFPSLHQLIGNYCLMLLAFLGSLAFIYLFRRLPESKGKSVYRIVQPWMSKRKGGVSTKRNTATVSDYCPKRIGPEYNNENIELQSTPL